jgi:hypothetical protein
VVVAELFLAEAWARAAVAVGEDVAALVLFGFGWCGVWHGGSPVPSDLCKVFKRNDLRPDFCLQRVSWLAAARSVVLSLSLFAIFAIR